MLGKRFSSLLTISRARITSSHCCYGDLLNTRFVRTLHLKYHYRISMETMLQFLCGGGLTSKMIRKLYPRRLSLSIYTLDSFAAEFFVFRPNRELQFHEFIQIGRAHV